MKKNNKEVFGKYETIDGDFITLGILIIGSGLFLLALGVILFAFIF